MKGRPEQLKVVTVKLVQLNPRFKLFYFYSRRFGLLIASNQCT